MSNTNFDKELDDLIDDIGHAGANSENRKEVIAKYKPLIKQAVEKHVIGEDVNRFKRQNIYQRDPEQKWYDAGWNDVKEIQRKALWGTTNE